MKIAICYISENGGRIAEKLAADLPLISIFHLKGKGAVSRWTKENFHGFEGHIYIMSLGIVYRVIAPYITDKYNDPAVVVIDDAARYSIAALSGHEGGANGLAVKTAGILGTVPIITTASETNRNIILGIGCRRGIAAKDVIEAVEKALADMQLTVQDIRQAVTVDIKRDEKGLVKAMEDLEIPLLFLDSQIIAESDRFDSVSKAAERQLGLPGVSEPCALMGGRKTRLIMKRAAYKGVTIALAREDEIER